MGGPGWGASQACPGGSLLVPLPPSSGVAFPASIPVQLRHGLAHKGETPGRWNVRGLLGPTASGEAGGRWAILGPAPASAQAPQLLDPLHVDAQAFPAGGSVAQVRQRGTLPRTSQRRKLRRREGWARTHERSCLGASGASPAPVERPTDRRCTPGECQHWPHAGRLGEASPALSLPPSDVPS